jgi:foldase protein PrsA
MNRTFTRSVLLLALIALSATACSSTTAPSAAVVGGTNISQSQLDADVAAFRDSDAFAASAKDRGESAALRKYEQEHLGVLIRIAVLEPEAEERSIEVTDADIDARLQEIRDSYADEATFNDAMTSQGLTPDELRLRLYENQLEGLLISDVTKDIVPADPELMAFYESNIENFTEVRSSHILVEENAAAIELADQLHAASPKELPELFAKLAEKNSLDTGSGSNGGDLGFSRYDEFVEPFANALRDLEVGDVSNPVRSEFGFHIIYLTARRMKSFAEVRDQLISELAGAQQQEAWATWVADAYDAADISVNSKVGELDPETQMIVDAGPEQIPGGEVPRPDPTQNPTAVPSPLG